MWFSAIAFVVSGLSFLAAGGQTWLMYEHNRISVMPKLDWRIAFGGGQASRVEVTLINAGLGPAKVSDIKLVVNNAIYPLSEGKACAVIEALTGATATAKGAACFAIDVDDFVYIKPDDKLVLYSSGTQPINADAITQLSAQALYCSLYDQCEDL